MMNTIGERATGPSRYASDYRCPWCGTQCAEVINACIEEMCAALGPAATLCPHCEREFACRLDDTRVVCVGLRSTADQKYLAKVAPLTLTPRERNLLQVVHELVTEQGVMPTYDCLAVEMGTKSRGSICGLMKEIERKGWIEREVGTRAMRFLHPPPMPDFGLEFLGQFDDAGLQAELLASLSDQPKEATA